MAIASRLLGWLVERDRREEILGDVTELAGTRSPVALWRDILSVCVRAPRVLRGSALMGAAALVITASVTARREDRRVVLARDPAGTFSLVFHGSQVVGASLDGVPVPPERLVRTAEGLVIRGGAGDRDLNIRLGPGGRFYWQGRAPLKSPSP